MIEVRASDNVRLLARVEVYENDPTWVLILWPSYSMDYHEAGLRSLIEHADPATPADTMRVFKDALAAIEAAKAAQA